MKKLFIVISLLVSIMMLASCEEKPVLNESFKSEGLENDQGYQNCLEYINNSSFESWKNIDKNIVKSQKVTEVVEEYVSIEKGKEDLLDSSDLIYEIGDTSGHNFANIVCDSETNEVIGYIPIE